MNSRKEDVDWPFINYEKDFSLVRLISYSETDRVRTGNFDNQRYKFEYLKNFGEWICGYIITEAKRCTIIQTFEGEIEFKPRLNLPFYINYNEKIAWISNKYMNLVSETLQLETISQFNFDLEPLISNQELQKGLSVRSIYFVQRDGSSPSRISFSGDFATNILFTDKNSRLAFSNSDIKNITLAIDLDRFTVPFSLKKNYLSIRRNLSPSDMIEFFETVFPLIPKSRQKTIKEYLD